jgi:hypothetical protein
MIDGEKAPFRGPKSVRILYSADTGFRFELGVGGNSVIFCYRGGGRADGDERGWGGEQLLKAAGDDRRIEFSTLISCLNAGI